ncbi:MAG TPA: hypothetical protein VK897_09405 [Anaerolineales bacterium]|nr:hypothetical protein [Anaerolineales bacterium]
MNRISILTTVVLLTMILSACGAPAVPTINPVDVQNTAAAAAFTMVAQTQAAIPTATPLPPTETATATVAATDTPLPLPTLDVTLTATTAPVSSDSNASVDPCSTRPLSPKQGRETVIRVVNTTKYAVRVSMYLNETAAHGECGYRSFDLSKNNDTVFTDLVQGCYNLWAWSLDNKKAFQVGSPTACINNPDKWTFEISESNIKFVGP